jgi:hypothetical protein
MTTSPRFQVAKERTKHAKSRLAIFLALLERTIRQRVRFMVKASAAGSAKMFIDPPSHQGLKFKCQNLNLEF